MNKLFYVFFLLSLSINSSAMTPLNICLTGKIELILPSYKAALLNAVNLAIGQMPKNKNTHIKTYFYDSEPLSPIRAYDKMIIDNCSAIIGFEYLSDLLLVEKQKNQKKIPIFTSYASSNDRDITPENVFIFVPSYDFQAKKMIDFLHKKFGVINKALIITEIDRVDLLKYKMAYESVLKNENVDYQTFDFIGNDYQLELKLNRAILNKNYNFVFVLSGAVGATKIINHMNDHKIVFIGTENFGSSTNQSLFVRLNDKVIRSYVIRNIDFLKLNKPLKEFMNKYTKKYSIMPSPLSAYTYDAMRIIFKTRFLYGSVNANNILKVNYEGATGSYIRNKKFHRSSQYVILSVGKNGFVYEN
jgi:ABC-type branched-subunit amino acid transport system substrate-binding protein